MNEPGKRVVVNLLVFAAAGQVVAGIALGVSIWQLGMQEFGRRVIFTNEFTYWQALSFLCTCTYLIAIIKFSSVSKTTKLVLSVAGALAPIVIQPCPAWRPIISCKSETTDYVGEEFAGSYGEVNGHATATVISGCASGSLFLCTS